MKKSNRILSFIFSHLGSFGIGFIFAVITKPTNADPFSIFAVLFASVVMMFGAPKWFK